MDTVRPKSALSNKSKLARTFQKVINLRTATRISSNNGICLLTPQGCRVKEQQEDDDVLFNDKSKHFDKVNEDIRARNRAVMEALVAKLFAGITSIKAAYAELQMAQSPYNSDAIQVADLAVVDELKAISELKRSFLKKELDLSPQVTLMLAEIQEQQGLMKTYEITIKKLGTEVDRKDSDIFELKKKLEESLSSNKSMEKKLNSSGSLSAFDNLGISGLNPTHFAEFLNHVTLRSIRSFVKILVREMESANWDLDAAVKFIEPEASFSKQSHRCFAFESFVCKTMFEGFNQKSFNLSSSGTGESGELGRVEFFDRFKKMRSVSPKSLFTQNPNSSFGKFLRSKYMQLVHAKMECSFFGNLNQRKMVTSCGYPETPFFSAFAEMSKRVWLLHALAYSLGEEEVTIFQVRKDSRFSEVYMECVTQEVLFSSGEIDSSPETELRVNFTVVPGFKIGKTVIQSQVYLSPAASPARRR